MARRKKQQTFTIDPQEARRIECLHLACAAADAQHLYAQAVLNAEEARLRTMNARVEELRRTVQAQSDKVDGAIHALDEARASLEQRLGISLSRYNIDSDTGVLSPAGDENKEG